MDNRVFNINGRTLEMLIAVLALAVRQDDGDSASFDEKPDRRFKSFRVDPNYGLILYSYGPSASREGVQKFLAPLSAEEVAPMVMSWVKEQHEKKVTFPKGQISWDDDVEHDGSNSEGWRCYVEDWGHVAGDYGAICAIVPAWMWHGK